MREIKRTVARGHPPLQVFVSSGMRTPLESQARAICFSAIGAARFHPWMFEYTPAAAESATDAYLGGVKESDVIVWLVGASTSLPVQRELEYGLELGRPFLVFGLPVDERDAETRTWMTRLRERFKTKDIRRVEDLEEELLTALDDFVAQAVRAQVDVKEPSELAALDGRVRALALARWLAIGLPMQVAQELVSDVMLGALPPQELPTDDAPLRFLVAPVGAGKTLAAVRFAQKAIVRARTDRSAPYPIWLGPRPADVDAQIEAALLAAGRARNSSVALVVDGLDEMPPAMANVTLEQVRVVALSSAGNQVLVTSRPAGIDVGPAELSAVPELSLDEAVALINRTFNVKLSPYDLYQLPEPVRAAVVRPLFALLLGRRYAAGEGKVSAVGQLIAELVLDAIGRAEMDQLSATGELARLARTSIDSGSQFVHPQAVGSRETVRNLLDTRLVTLSDDGVSFSLPILRDWFGGIALQTGLIDAPDLVADSARLERWRFAIFMALATLPQQSVEELMTTLAVAVPGFASEAMASTAWQNTQGTPSDTEIGRRLLNATSSLLRGLGPAGSRMGSRVGTSLSTLGVKASRDGLAYAWARRRTEPPFMALPPEFSFASASDPEWTRRKFRGGISDDPLWTWRTARDDIADELKAHLVSRAFFPDLPETRAESAWHAALLLKPIGEHFYGPLDAQEIRERVTGLGAARILEGRNGLLIPLQPLRDLLARGDAQLMSPYPPPDEERGGWIWSGFSHEVLLERTRAVYGAALAIYEGFVEYFLAGLGSSLLLHRLLPARIRGTLDPGGGAGIQSAPGLTYIIDPLPVGHETVIDIQLEDEGAHIDLLSSNDQLRANAELIARLRPDGPPWLGASAHSTVLNVFGADPAMRLAENLLTEDLQRIGWLDSRRLH